MEIFTKAKAKAIKLKSHLDKYLVADDDQQTVRQSHRSATSRRARWLVELVENNPNAIRLKSCHGHYLTASNAPFLLGMTGHKVIQKSPENFNDFSTEWQPIRDGFQIKLRAFGGTFLRANGATPPWRNKVTHDNSFTGTTNNWILWDLEVVDVPEDEKFNDYLSMVSSLSSLSDDISGLEFESPVSVHSSFSPRTPTLSMNKRRPSFPVTGMDLFHNAKAVRLRGHHDKYLHADDDEESVSQDRDGTSKNARWTVEFVSYGKNSDDLNNSIIRLKSCFNKYLTASNQPFLLGMTGRKVLQTLPRRLDSSVEWEPIKDGHQVKLKTRYGQFLRANGGLPPWRNSITHDIPHRTATQDWILWDVDVVEISVVSPAPRPPSKLKADSFASSESSSPSFSGHESSDYSSRNSPPRRDDGRTIYYHIIGDGFGEMDENSQGFSIPFKGTGVEELTRRLEEETGLQNITVCTRSPLNGKLYPLKLQLPPNNVTMHVVVVQSSSEEEGDDLLRNASHTASQGICKKQSEEPDDLNSSS